MRQRSDVHQLTLALRAANATSPQIRLAAILLAVTDLAHALTFVRQVTAPPDICPVCGADNGVVTPDGYGEHRHALKCWACGCP